MTNSACMQPHDGEGSASQIVSWADTVCCVLELRKSIQRQFLTQHLMERIALAPLTFQLLPWHSAPIGFTARLTAMAPLESYHQTTPY